MDKEEFEGATAVNAAEIEQMIAHAADGTTENDSEESVAQLERQLLAVTHELQALQSTLNEAEDAPATTTALEAAGTSQLDDDTKGGVVAARMVQDSLHQAVVKERLSGLDAHRQTLIQKLTQLGHPPTSLTVGGESGTMAQIPKKKSSNLLPPLPGKASKQPKQRRQRPAAQLEEADLFDQVPAPPPSTLVETERDRLIRLGIVTPFDALGGFERRVQNNNRPPPPSISTARSDRDAKYDASLAKLTENLRKAKESKPTAKLVHPSELPAPRRAAKKVDERFWRASASGNSAVVKKPRKSTLPRAQRSKRRKKTGNGDLLNDEEDDDAYLSNSSYGPDEDEDYVDDQDDIEDEDDQIDIDVDAAGEYDDADEMMFLQRQRAHTKRKKKIQQQRQRRQTSTQSEVVDLIDDADVGGASVSLEEQCPDREALEGEAAGTESLEDGDIAPEDITFQGGFTVPGDVYDRLFDYQRTGVKWMWELHTQRAGGIIGDEMGLGKTIQVIAFLAGLHYSGKFKSALIVCPATILRQWLREIRAWYPSFRVAIYHDLGAKGQMNSRSLVLNIEASGCGILLTTYDQLRVKRDELLSVRWGYVVLDEGHKIRNPDAAITLIAKQLPTVHRIIMTGSPIQNKLTELWSLFDFVFPGKLGTLPVFEAQFAIPIQIGGYANATALQVSTAYKCAVLLRDLVSPYLLRRRKADVAASLPKKTERVLFCMLTPEQRDMYRSYLSSKELQEILGGNKSALAGVDILRKICNHPDLLERANWEGSDEYGSPLRSGKMMVLDRVLTHWHEEGHKALVFTQTQQMLDILEKLITNRGWSYHRMDGSTAVAQRSRLVDDFNTNDDIFCFLLTTRVGGLGVNLTGANRCIIFDPDWNPSTDVQARERAWRVGQKREVTVYRLITSGTIEEKVYHRQVYKQFLTDRVLKDPRQRRFFKAKDLSDLFTLGEEYADGTETADIFASLNSEITAADLPTTTTTGGGRGRRGSSLTRNRSSIASFDEEGGIIHLADQQDAEEEEDDDEPQAGGSQQQQQPTGDGDGGDAGILRELFESTGVQSAVDHERIENAHDPERKAAEKEAVEIARRAAQALRQSSLACQSAPVSQPTWTGRSGAAGAPGQQQQHQQQPRFGQVLNARIRSIAEAGAAALITTGSTNGPSSNNGLADVGRPAVPSSTAILARIRQRQQAAAPPGLQQASHLAVRVVEFLKSQGGEAGTNEVVRHFQDEVPATQLPLFKGVLKQVATLGSRGEGKVWVLKAEFGGQQ